MKRYIALLIAALVISCGGSDPGGGSTSGSTPGGGIGGGGTGGGGGGSGGGSAVCASNAGASATAGAHVEECDTAVSLSSGWTSADTRYGWSGGTAVQSDVPGATASFSFTGTSVRWLGSRGRKMGKALVKVDGATVKTVDLYAIPNDEIRTPIFMVNDLSDGPHTLSLEVVSGIVVVDAFDVQPQTTVSHWQDTDPNAKFSAGWTKASTSLPWSGSGISNLPELPVTAQETYTTGETLTLPFRGTAIGWVGYRGPDGGIATVQVDGGAPVEVDTYAPAAKFQELLHTASGLADANHTLTITATGRRNAASSAPRIVVDAFDVITPGRRYEEYDKSIVKSVGPLEEPPHWNRNINRVWTEGNTATSNRTGATLTFSFNGTSVSWIGCEKSSAGGSANVYIDGVLIREVRLAQRYPIEGYQMTVFRQDGLAPGPHTLTIEVTSRDLGPYVVVDAFDVR